MSLTQDKILRLRKLTALSGEKTISIDNVLDSFDVIKNSTLTLPETITRSGASSLRLREDTVISSPISGSTLLRSSGQRVIGNQIALGSIMHGE